jgi:hypothetical protein
MNKKNLKYKSWENTMKIRLKKPDTTFQVKSLKYLQINIPLWKIKLNNKLTKLSYLIDPKIHPSRKIKFFCKKKECKTKLLLKQNFKCSYCNNQLLEWSKIDFLLHKYTEGFDIIENDKTNKFFKLKQKSKKDCEILHSNKIFIDAIISSVLTNQILMNDTLSKSKILIHNKCYRIKKNYW